MHQYACNFTFTSLPHEDERPSSLTWTGVFFCRYQLVSLPYRLLGQLFDPAALGPTQNSSAEVLRAQGDHSDGEQACAFGEECEAERKARFRCSRGRICSRSHEPLLLIFLLSVGFSFS